MQVVWSCGGGLQSVAIGVLIREGVLPVPSLAGIVDTGRERRTTWDYLHQHLNPYLAPVGLQVEVISHSYAYRDLYAPSGLTLMPAYTDEGRLPPYCSGEWKREAFLRWLRHKGVEQCEMWIGFSLDELRRVPKLDKRKWCAMGFPLIDKMLNRTMCAAIIRNAGLPLPGKSRCYMCPHQNAEEWAEVMDDPEDWARAVAVDEEIRRNDPQGKGLYVHYSRKPLAMVSHGDGIEIPHSACEGGVCFV